MSPRRSQSCFIAMASSISMKAARFEKSEAVCAYACLRDSLSAACASSLLVHKPLRELIDRGCAGCRLRSESSLLLLLLLLEGDPQLQP